MVMEKLNKIFKKLKCFSGLLKKYMCGGLLNVSDLPVYFKIRILVI